LYAIKNEKLGTIQIVYGPDAEKDFVRFVNGVAKTDCEEAAQLLGSLPEYVVTDISETPPSDPIKKGPFGRPKKVVDEH
jgi:hypothetical protein